MKKITNSLGITLILFGFTSCQVTTYGGVGGRVASTPFYSGSSASWDWNPFEKSKIEDNAKKSLWFFEDEDFTINYVYCYFKAKQALDKGEHLIVDECQEAYTLSKKMCFQEKNMQHCASVRNLSTEIYNDKRIATKAKNYLKYKNPDKIDFHMEIIQGNLIVDYKKTIYLED